MPRGDPSKIVPNSARTPQKIKENATKAGQASGQARRKKTERRNIFQDVLSGTYTAKDKHGNTRQMTGEEMLIQGIAQNLSDPKSRNWLGTVKLISESLGLTLTEDARKKAEAELKKIKAETKLTEEKTKALRGVKDGAALIEDDDLTRALEAVAAEMEQGNNGDE